MNECKLRDPKTIGADHTRCYRGSKRGQAVTIERFSLSIPSHTGREVKWQGHTPVWLLAEYSSHPKKDLIGERGKAHEAPAEREGLPGRMPMGAGFFEKARADSETWDLGLGRNEGELFSLSPPVAYVVGRPTTTQTLYQVKERSSFSLVGKAFFCLFRERGLEVLRKSRRRQLTYGSGAEPQHRDLGQHLFNSQS